MNQVVITGIGVVSPIGNDHNEFSKALKAGRAADPETREFGPAQYVFSEQFFPVRNFSPPKRATILDPYIQYILKAVEEALADSALDPSRIDRERLGIAVSSSKGGVSTFERFYERFLKNPSALLGARVYANFLPNMAAQWIARHWRISGAAKPVVAACATGLFAVIEGVRMIEEGEVDWCIAGAGDASATSLMLAGYRQMGVLSKNGMRPFDKRRDGFLLGEGAGILILERKETAKARAAKIYGTVLGHQYGFEASHTLAFSESGDGLSYCLDRLLEKTDIKPTDIDYLNLHGTATKDGDRYETKQIKRSLGKDAFQIPMSSTKSLTGHMLGASGAVEIIACLIAMRDGFIPPTANLTEPDRECDLNYTPIHSKAKQVNLACSVSLGFGGQLAAILIGR